ncbi:hypothetical protein LAV84_27420 [Rhizobium sp. VS19-DR104.2]|uniref:ATP-binding protein n=1 Tax=unclassified Rhizobium TaxID=2613769 RepID=UPI001C5BDB0D|nr:MULTISPECIES: hypothetical protein [unclassified Rhizobium]MBZ5763264.1 hypothetical protein [Rhizobium sp. VS19-DR96]MBZ5769369.1 hypothetical protein [Rhizobium sp. VS19-DR129.2]MBZ5776925.1 hypothetical protein [Rhizobium sp. VS19-DRK62.2]MBZ5787865.1 hypothetical protein [Rhizobium sp. VS19-DR121]MBZ5805322.1 hypothetical protein [Rhizobium sp. VS19-DR181]
MSEIEKCDTMHVSSSIVDTLKRVCAQIDAKILVEETWNCVGQITYKSGVRRYFRTSTFDLNTMGASSIARDKQYSRFFLHSMGYPATEGESFFSETWARKVKASDRGYIAALAYARQIGFPVFVKPNSKSRGVGVSLVRNEGEFNESARIALQEDKVILVERPAVGNDYRVVVLDGKVISAYHRLPLTVTGDGQLSLRELVDGVQQEFRRNGRGETIDLADFRIRRTLEAEGLTFESVLESGKSLKMLENANLSSGGTAIDVTDRISEGFTRLARDVSRDMGLRLAGVDLMIDGLIEDTPSASPHRIIEINSAPGLDHYASLGIAQRKIVDDLYYKLVIAMERPGERFL